MEKKRPSRSEDDEEDDDFEDVDDKIVMKELTDSSKWPIARTIFTTLTLKGKILIEKISEKKSKLVMEIQDLGISKLDMHKGEVNKVKKAAEGK